MYLIGFGNYIWLHHCRNLWMNPNKVRTYLILFYNFLLVLLLYRLQQSFCLWRKPPFPHQGWQSMATIRHSLQRDVFEPTEERLVGVLYVTKPGKKKKTSFLCATINKEKPVYATIHQVLWFVSHLCFGRNNFNFCSFPKFFLIMALIPHSTFINSLLLRCSGRNLQCSPFINYFCTIHTNSHPLFKHSSFM